MTPTRTILAVLGAVLVLAATGCGSGSGDVPAGAVAVVDGVEIPKADLDELIGVAKRAYASRKQEFPKVGSPEYQSLQQQYLAFLVQREEFSQAADDFGVELTQKDVDKALEDFVKSRFEGNRKELDKALEQQGFTLATFRKTLETSVLSQKLFDEVTKDVEVTQAEILDSYTQNQSQYSTPDSRDVRHILIAEKGKDGQVDFAASKREADRVYQELKDGADFATLAKEKSDDPGSKAEGGKLTISRGQTVPEFDKTAFELDQGEISKPVKTQYGYHVIEALSPVRKGKTTSLAEARASIRQTLLQQKRNDRMTEWVEKLRKSYDGKVSYAAGLEPPEIPDTTESQ